MPIPSWQAVIISVIFASVPCSSARTTCNTKDETCKRGSMGQEHLLLQVTGGKKEAKEAGIMKNLGYAASGYNIFYADPLTTKAGVDPAFTTHAGEFIFNFEFKGSTTLDGRYQVPEGMSIRSDHGCSLSFSSRTIATSAQYQGSLSVLAKVSAKSMTGSFSASAGYRSFSEESRSQKRRMMTSTAECSVYSVSVSSYSPPRLTDNFLAAINSLPKQYGNGRAYFDFLDAFGTHAISSVKMGARFGIRNFVSEEAWDSLEEKGVDVEAAAAYSGVVKAGGSLKVNVQKEAQTSFESATSEMEIVSLGSKPARGDALSWAQQAIAEPMPIQYQLELICEWISDANKKKNCKKALQAAEYCTKRVKRRGDVEDCTGYSENECAWARDCPDTQECYNQRCAVPRSSGALVPIHEFSSWNHWHTFHPGNPLKDEKRLTRNVFWAPVSKQDADYVHQYCTYSRRRRNRRRRRRRNYNSYHLEPAWDRETNCGSSVFNAYKKQKIGTVPIYQYKHHKSNIFTFHPAPEWSGEGKERKDPLFYAYPKSAKCSAHSRCDRKGGDCCPTKHGNWLGCCDAPR